jgi:hypothetical protein
MGTRLRLKDTPNGLRRGREGSKAGNEIKQERIEQSLRSQSFRGQRSEVSELHWGKGRPPIRRT